MPSALGGKDVGLSGIFPEPERSGAPLNGIPTVQSGVAVLFRGETDGDIW